METTGNRWRLASVTHFLSCRLSSVTEWSEATEQMHFRILGCNETDSNVLIGLLVEV